MKHAAALLLLCAAALPAAPSRIDREIRAARQALWKGDTAAAEQILTKALRTQPANPEARKLLEWTWCQHNLLEAKRFLRQHDWNEADAAIRRADGFRPTPEARRLAAAVAAGRRDEASRSVYDAAVNRARRAAAAGDFSSAEREFRAALKIFPAGRAAASELAAVEETKRAAGRVRNGIATITATLTRGDWKTASRQMDAVAREATEAGVAPGTDPLLPVILAQARGGHAEARQLARETAQRGVEAAAAFLAASRSATRAQVAVRSVPAVAGSSMLVAAAMLWTGFRRMKRETTA